MGFLQNDTVYRATGIRANVDAIYGKVIRIMTATTAGIGASHEKK